MNAIFQWVRNIVIYLLLMTVIMNLLDKSPFLRYVKFVSGLILIIICITPVLKLFRLEETFNYLYSIDAIPSEIGDMDEEFTEMENEQMNSVVLAYKETTNEQINKLLEKQNLYLVDSVLEVNEDESSEEYGDLLSMNITASHVQQKTDAIKKVEKVEIEDIEISSETTEEENSTEDTILSPEEIKVRNKLADFFNLDSSKIILSIQE